MADARSTEDELGILRSVVDDVAGANVQLARARDAALAESQALRLSLEDERAKHAELRAVALHALRASELGVSEGEGVRRMQRLAKLLGYRHDANERGRRGFPPDAQAAAQEAYRLAMLLSEEVEGPGGWAFGLFIYREPQSARPGDVIQVSRDRERTTLAVARWLKETLEAKGVKPKAQG